MESPVQFNSLLVPVDFSAPSLAAFEQALALAAGENPVVIALHVLDRSLAEFAAQHDLGAADDVLKTMRRKAEEQLALLKERGGESVEVDVIVCEGLPFLEIIKKAEDFAVDAIVMGKVGARGTLETLLFGSTAERVLRGSRCPVVVLPVTAAR
jgi:nucleotide-binding universal stress UspA family protein